MGEANNLGIKIAKPGYDVNTAGDVDLVFSSSWPSLPIAFEHSTNDFSGTSGGYINHNLGFKPLTVGWTQIGAKTYMIFPNVTNNQLYLGTSFPNPQTYGYVHVKCYNINLEKDAVYPFIKPATTPIGAYDPDFGIKIAKEGRDINSSDMRDFILHSRCQSPQILSVSTRASIKDGGDTITYKNPAGYVSWAFGYAGVTLGPLAGQHVYAPFHSQAYPKTTVDNTTQVYSLLLASGVPGCIVVLRDPMFAPTNIEVIY